MMETERAMALFAVEVSVLVVSGTFVMPLTDLVAKGATAVLNGMDEVMLKQESEGAEDGASFGSSHTFFQFA